MLGNIWNSGRLRRMGGFLSALALMIRRITLPFLAAILSMLSATVSFSEGNLEIEEGNMFIIPIDHPKILMPSEFVKIGRPIHTFAPAFYTKKFRAAFSKRPNVLSCLSPNQPDENSIDLSLFLWQEFSSAEEVRICVFYVADILGKRVAMHRWFSEQGFHVDMIDTPSQMRIFATDKLRRGNKPRNFWAKRFNILSRDLFGVPEWRIFDNNSGVNITYSAGDIIFNVDMNRAGK